MRTSEKKHVIITCYDSRLDNTVTDLISSIRAEGGILVDNKDILRPAGGVHALTRNTYSRGAFYDVLTGYHDIAGTTVFHLLPHTNCQFCGAHLKEKIGNGTQSDLRFHVRSAEKLREGAILHFSEHSPGNMPEIDVRIILTVDQRIVTIEEANALLPEIPEHHGHGHPCYRHHPHPHDSHDQHAVLVS